MQQLLKDWRQDALHKHQYESAIYIGDKLLAITSEHFQLSTVLNTDLMVLR